MGSAAHRTSNMLDVDARPSSGRAHRRAGGLVVASGALVSLVGLVTVIVTAAPPSQAGAQPIVAATTTTTKAASTSTVAATVNTTTNTTTTSPTAPAAGTNGTSSAQVAEPAGIVIPATPLKPARRLKQMGTLSFPMGTSPRCAILDNFGDPRSSSRRHEGIDILATLDQPVYAVADGVLNKQYVVGGPNSSLSGNAWQLTTNDGTYYFYAHLSRFVDGLVLGAMVRAGDLIAYVGDTGDPGPGNYHLHFEVHPRGGAAVNSLPLLEIPSACTIT